MFLFLWKILNEPMTLWPGDYDSQ